MNELYERVADMLARAYRRVQWHKMGARSAYDIFAHRVKVAGNMNSITRFLEKLCHGLHLQSISIDPQKIEFLEENRDEVLRMIREETVYLVLLAAKKSKDMKAQKKGKQKKLIKKETREEKKEDED